MGETKTKTEITIILKESPTSTGNATNVVKEVTGLLIVGQVKVNRKTMTSTTYSWEKYYVEQFRTRTIKNILNIG